MKFTGERYIPSEQGRIRLEHYHRYAIALDIVKEKDVLDVACGEGYGSFFMADIARSVVGVDISDEAVQHASVIYKKPNLTFRQGSAIALDFDEASFDVVVSFETIEHLAEQAQMLAEIRRVLRPDGLLVISSPNRPIYSEESGEYNEFHVKELDFNEFDELLKSQFPAIQYFGQRMLMGSVIQSIEGGQSSFRAWHDDGIDLKPKAGHLSEPVYFIAVCGTSSDGLPGIDASVFYPDKLDLVKEYVGYAKWAHTLDQTVTERDTLIVSLNQLIVSLNQKIEEVSVLSILQHEKNTSLVQELNDKQVELMKMSDWAQSMALELNRRNVSSVSNVGKTAIRRAGALARKRLAQSFLGDMVRHVRDSLRFREKQIPLEVIRQSVLDNHGRLIITFPIITWDFRWQRPQHIVSRLRDRGFSVLYVAMSLSPLGRRIRNNKDAVAQLAFNELAPHVNQIWLNSSEQLNIYTDPIEGDDLFNISIGLEAIISELRPKSIVYLVQFPGWGRIAQDLQKKLGGKVVFDCMDDHGGFSTNTEQALKTEEVLMENADLVITSSNLLEERVKLINPNTIQVKNGTEFDHFKNPIRNRQLDHLSDRPIIGYYGAISDWFDMSIVAHCALQRPDWNFVLIGATFGADLQPVAGLKNIHLLGEKPYKDLPGYLAYFDVCTIPFKIIPLTLATNPVKFYEYLSAGKPVVSVDLPELLAYKEDCYLACSPDEFLAQLERAYDERKDEKLIECRLKLASENSWDARVSAILESEIFKTYLH
jgi:ubiquinone/menaquinone biosynthesis C-methylase UbiE/glycosyltransferase involved in cell wall biosynthesis